MIVTLPETSTSEVAKKLVQLRENGGAATVGRVLTLVVCLDAGAGTEDAIKAANDASREHPCRVIVIERGDRSVPSQLDAEIRLGGDAGAAEVVVLGLSGPLADHGHAVVIPFLLADTPVVVWWPEAAPKVPATDRLGLLAGRRITDAMKAADAASILQQRLASYAPGDTDLAWTRITTWRALLASALDQPPFEPITAVTVAGPAGSPDIDLLAGWIKAELDVPVSRETGGFHVTLERPSGPLKLALGEDNIAVIQRPGQPDGQVVITPPTVSECIAEELRRLDQDEVYRFALGAVGDVAA